MLKVGWKASAEQFGPRQLVDFTVRAEQDGLDSVFISDHFQPWRHNDGHAPFAMSWLAADEAVALGAAVADSGASAEVRTPVSGPSASSSAPPS